MKPVDIRFGPCAEYNINTNAKDVKFKIGDHVRISKDKNIFAKVYTPNWSEQVLMISKVENTVPWTAILMVKQLMVCLMKKNAEDKSNRI